MTEDKRHRSGQDINAVWQAALGELQLQMPRATFDTWLKGTQPIAHKNGLLTVGTQNTYAKDWLENRLKDKIARTVAGILGHPVELEFRVDTDSKAADDAVELLRGLPDETPAQPHSEANAGQAKDADRSGSTGLHSHLNGNSKNGSSMHLNPRYTFERFVVGNGNRLAHAAALSVAEQPAGPYNPLFIHGGVGLGKTHLLHAAGHLPAARGLQVRLVSSEQFTNDLITAIRTQTTDAFREKYRELDVLLIDDVQFIAGKERTQEELFHTFNTLHGANKQIIFTSDRHPKALATLEERLRSRFEWGLTADIQAPDLETRIAILQSKAERQSVPIPPDVLETIAHQIESNIRELEGALNQVIMHAKCMNCPVSVDTARQALAHLLSAKPEPPAIPTILEIVADFYELTLEDLLGRSRSRRISLPRQIAMYILREECNLSFPQIGDELGGRDHSTAIHAHDKITQQLTKDNSLRREIMTIKRRMYRLADD